MYEDSVAVRLARELTVSKPLENRWLFYRRRGIFRIRHSGGDLLVPLHRQCAPVGLVLDFSELEAFERFFFCA